MRKQNAFSLVELLIAIGVIGVLLTIAIPTFTKVSPQKEVMLMKRAYNIVSTTVSELINDVVLYPDYDLGFAYIPEGKTAGYTPEYFCNNFSDKINTTDYSYDSSTKTCEITTPDGIEWVITPVFYDGSGNLKTDSSVTDGVYSSSFNVKIKDGSKLKKTFDIYMRYDGKLSVKDADVLKVLKDPARVKLED